MFRDNGSEFKSRILDKWAYESEEYNTFRPHSSLNELTPRDFAEKYVKLHGIHNRFSRGLPIEKTDEVQDHEIIYFLQIIDSSFLYLRILRRK